MCGFEFLNDPETDTQGFCMFNDKICVVSFRGTESVQDWLTNLNFFQVCSFLLLQINKRLNFLFIFRSNQINFLNQF